MTKQRTKRNEESSAALDHMIAAEVAFTRSVKNIERYIYENATQFSGTCKPGSHEEKTRAVLDEAVKDLEGDAFVCVSPEVREAGRATIEAALTSVQLNSSLGEYWAGLLANVEKTVMDIEIDQKNRVVTLTKFDLFDSPERQIGLMQQFVARLCDAGLCAFLVRGRYKFVLHHRPNDPMAAQFAYYAGVLRSGGVEFGETEIQAVAANTDGEQS
jgi:hypothetical protein